MSAPGEGVLECYQIGGRIRQISNFSYPLRLVNPQCSPLLPKATAEEGREGVNGRCHNHPHYYYPSVNYMLTYGGGLVHGDHIRLRVKVGPQVALLMLTQGSTKVFPKREGRLPSTLVSPLSRLDPTQTYQTIIVDVAPGALLCLLPDPVTCFGQAQYHQRQRVHLQDPATSALVMLDWFTSGRADRGEHWDFDVYSSVNVITIPRNSELSAGSAGRRRSEIVVRDALLLNRNSPLTSFKARLRGYKVIGYLVVLGASLEYVANRFRQLHEQVKVRPFTVTEHHHHHQQRQHGQPTSGPDHDNAGGGDDDFKRVVWSVSEIREFGTSGVAVRFAGSSTDLLKRWLKSHLLSLRELIGDSAFDMFYYN
ncbi:hypothetical protein EV182_001196 [Spiromyces aspiralis]|uniref:Uncharacterized protein n=1 Tax=Spiromyces aspiralis TaxID=68401 RepID=A0ACC1HG89_9FUNG|nr:hypothetical protein EV182_001196 [Spiromyces aspiralis]